MARDELIIVIILQVIRINKAVNLPVSGVNKDRSTLNSNNTVQVRHRLISLIGRYVYHISSLSFSPYLLYLKVVDVKYSTGSWSTPGWISCDRDPAFPDQSPLCKSASAPCTSPVQFLLNSDPFALPSSTNGQQFCLNKPRQ